MKNNINIIINKTIKALDQHQTYIQSNTNLLGMTPLMEYL